MSIKPWEPYQLKDNDWNTLINRINRDDDKNITPFLGAGTSAPPLLRAPELAKAMAKHFDYPPYPDTFCDDEEQQPNNMYLCDFNLGQVAQFVAINNDGLSAKFWIKETLQDKFPNFEQEDEPHGLLADLELPLYVTTNYDDFMAKALQTRGKNPKRQLCPWNEFVKSYHLYNDKGFLDPADPYTPSVEEPLVYHLHGHMDIPESLVLTEDDYLEFMVRMSKSHELIPSGILLALRMKSLLFVGYGLKDWNLRVLLRWLQEGMTQSTRLRSITVQYPNGEYEARQFEYFHNYYLQQIFDLHVYWGSARQFAQELRQRGKFPVNYRNPALQS